jgi:hypothetical protein
MVINSTIEAFFLKRYRAVRDLFRIPTVKNNKKNFIVYGLLIFATALLVFVPWLKDHFPNPHLSPTKKDAEPLRDVESSRPNLNSVQGHHGRIKNDTKYETSLNESEKKLFFNDIQVVFGSLALATVDPTTLAPHLSKLNARGTAGLEAIIKELRNPAGSDDSIKRRMHLIDYLNYRMAWDKKARIAAKDLVLGSIPADTPLRYQATTLIEKAEIVGGLAALDFDETSLLLRSIGEGRLKRIAINAARDALINQGLPGEEVERKINFVSR